jgi:DNA invertase Pin-like site-specific DNA recombinase
MSELTDKIRAMKDADPSIRYIDIARALDCGVSTVSHALNSDQRRESTRRTNAKRHQAKLAWQNEFDRSEAGRGRCPACGGLRGVGAVRHNFELCRGCHLAKADERADRIVELYDSGLPIKQIAERVGTTVNALSVDLNRLRKAGRVGYRYKGWKQRQAA